jgi:hypothetical protein
MLAGADLRECHFYGAVMRRPDLASLSLIDSSGNKSEVDPEYSSYVPAKKDIFLENVNPDVTRPGEVIFTVASGASGFKLQVGDTNAFSGKNDNVDLGF